MNQKESSPKYTIAGLDKLINPIVNFLFYYRLIFIAACLTAVIILMMIVNRQSTETERIRNVVSVLTGGSIVIGIFFSLLNYEYNHNKTKRDTKVAKEVLSFNTAFEWHRPNNVENLRITSQFYQKHKHLLERNKPNKFSDALQANDAARGALISIFNYFECIALGIEQGFMDAEFMKKYYKPLFIDYYFSYEAYINYRRSYNKRPDDWISFTNLVKRWQLEGDCDC